MTVEQENKLILIQEIAKCAIGDTYKHTIILGYLTFFLLFHADYRLPVTHI